MTIKIGPKGKQYMFRVMLGYQGHGPLYQAYKFGNGVALRVRGFHAMAWWPRGVQCGDGT